jgi:ankyrin repeat protein
MSDAIPLPPRPNLDQYKKLARDFQRACESSDPTAIRTNAAHWVETVTRLQGQEITPGVQQQIERDATRIEHHWHALRKSEPSAPCRLTEAQFFVAREHGFASWPKFSKHVEALARANSPDAVFETAADAIIAGDRATLDVLLRQNPELVRARSTREHRSTLLHYVSANGIEDFRQKTPQNIVEIAKMLLDAGADVNAESDAYGGRSTTLVLTATSVHPETAGVQIPLLELLLERGALIDSPDGSSTVNACLHNGRGLAAEFLADRGARLDLEAASGVGSLELVMSCFDDSGSLKAPATQRQTIDGFTWACEYGRIPVVDYLLQKAVKADTKLHRGETGLHWAAFGGHAGIVRLLLERGAPADAIDDTHHGTPLGWALYAWGFPQNAGHERYYAVVALLAQAGATLDPQWYEGDGERQRAVEKLRSDPRMQAALRGETTG